MPTPGEITPEQRQALFDDFYAECDEQLNVLQEGLVQLENAGSGNILPEILESLYRNVHTVKGNSTIVGLQATEELAHATEDLLRALTKGTVQRSADTDELLFQSVHRLAQLVTAHRNRHALPAISDLVGKLTTASGRSPVAMEKAEPESGVSRSASEQNLATASSTATLRCTFAPSRERDARGVNLNSVRARLSELGKILSGRPQVQPGGSMRFEFEIAAVHAPENPTAWEEDGIVFADSPALTRAPAPEATPPIAAAGEEHGSAIAPSHYVRVDLSRLDELMRIAGELVIHRSRLEDRLNRKITDGNALKEINVSISRSLRDLREAITRVRLVPIAEIFSRMPFVIRDLARQSTRRARLVTEGQHTEVDKYLVERLKEPLLHLVRNAFSHGLEEPGERRAAGKSEEGTITLRAHAAGGRVALTISDDGRGIDPDAIARRARKLGLSVPAQLDSTALIKLICSAGFSTRDEADRTSGRGVGMSVVENVVRELGGTLTMTSERGRGTSFNLQLPLTLSILDTLIVSVGSEICAVPQGSVEEILQIRETDVQEIQQTEVIRYRGAVLPLQRLKRLFRQTANSPKELPVLVVGTERGLAGLVVDRVHHQREVVVRPLSDPWLKIPGLAGATELGDGRPVLILDPNSITQGVVRPVLADTSAN